MQDGDRECDWVLIEGKMSPAFLYLEDLAPNPGLEALDIDGEIMDDITLILEELNTYYTDLYTAWDRKSSQEIASFLNKVKSLPKVLGDTSGLIQPIQKSEIAEAIESLWPGKSPSSDGLTSSFYKHFCIELSPILTVVFNEAYCLGRLSLTQYLAIIVLLYKKGSKNKSENYCPISLTNTDYKILAYVLTHHLNNHLFALISPHQTAYIKG